MTLRLEIAGADQPVDALPGNRRIVVGRKSPGSVVNPDIDLSPYEAEPKGVSRFHASLYRQDNTLVLTDLRSLNHTYINGLRLYPHEVRVLRDGDEVRFGQLTVRVRFRSAEELATTGAITPAAES
jgi:pSer/pThr/pTyr-binding forkhead associated (FHA) protein